MGAGTGPNLGVGGGNGRLGGGCRRVCCGGLAWGGGEAGVRYRLLCLIGERRGSGVGLADHPCSFGERESGLCGWGTLHARLENGRGRFGRGGADGGGWGSYAK